jgi:hypothetical protein
MPQPISKQELASQAGDADVVSVGPGRVDFTTTRTGRWLGFGEHGGRLLVDGGGWVVLARSASGEMVTVADTRRAMDPLDGVAELPVVHEGAEHGARYPSGEADDDGDGLVDEDRLDGVDNDGDGDVDEDFAAMGDEMAVAAALTPPGDAAPAVGGQPGLARSVMIHQQACAWSLAHIDGMVAVRVTVRNTGHDTLEDVRVGAVIERRGRADISTETLNSGTDAFGFETPLAARAMVLSDGEWPAVGAVFASNQPRSAETSWLTGAVAPGVSMTDVVRAADRPDALARPDRPAAAGGDVSVAQGGDTPPNPTTTAYGISPVLGRLEPGEELCVYVALVAIDDASTAERVINDAYRTIEGDGGHRLIPPPMSLTRRTLWGSYEMRVPGDARAGVTLTINNPRARGIEPSEIARLKGLDLRGATRRTVPSGDVIFELSGEMPSGIQGGQRVVVSGRTRGGRAFDAILRPVGGGEGVGSVTAASRYWNTAGKLDETLLSSSPNPFRVATTIEYEVPSQLTDENGTEMEFSGQVETSVKVYNVAGRLVSTIAEASLGPGRYDVQWNASNGTGQGVASGVYYVKLQIGKRFITKRLIQLK